MDRYVEVLDRSPTPVVVVMGPRIRNTGADYSVLEAAVSGLNELKRKVTFRVSSMITGPEEFVERIAPLWGHDVEVHVADGIPPNRARLLNKNDDAERDASMLLGADSLWVWKTDHPSTADDDLVIIALELNVPVFYFMPESSGYEILEVA